MSLQKRALLPGSAFVLLLFLVACGGTANNDNSSTTYATATPQSNTITPTPTNGGNTSVVIKTASATIENKAATILTDVNGKTLYYFTPDTASTVACSDGCAQNWPPLLFSGSGSPQSSNELSGKLTTLDANGGKQIVYNGHPLYTYIGDTAVGQTNGQGVGSQWYIATVDLKPNKA